jgi:hypothetical protein
MYVLTDCGYSEPSDLGFLLPNAPELLEASVVPDQTRSSTYTDPTRTRREKPRSVSSLRVSPQRPQEATKSREATRPRMPGSEDGDEISCELDHALLVRPHHV